MLPLELRLEIWKHAVASIDPQIVELPLKRALPSFPLAGVNREARSQLIKFTTVLEMGKRTPLVMLNTIIWLGNHIRICPGQDIQKTIINTPSIQRLAITGQNWENFSHGDVTGKSITEQWWAMIKNIKEIAVIVGVTSDISTRAGRLPTGEGRWYLASPRFTPGSKKGKHHLTH